MNSLPSGADDGTDVIEVVDGTDVVIEVVNVADVVAVSINKSKYITSDEKRKLYNENRRNKAKHISSDLSMMEVENLSKTELFNIIKRKSEALNQAEIKTKSLQSELSEIVSIIKNGSSNGISTDINSVVWNKYIGTDNQRQLIMTLPSSPEIKSILNKSFGVENTTEGILSPLTSDIMKVAFVNGNIMEAISSKHTNNQRLSKLKKQNNFDKFVRLQSDMMYNGNSRIKSDERYRKQCRNTFNPPALSESMDNSANNALGFEGLDILKNTEDLQLYEKGLLYSKTTYQNYNADLAVGVELGLINSTFSKISCDLDMIKVIVLLIANCFQLRKYGCLSETEFKEKFDTLKCIFFTITLDGAKLTEHTGMTILAIGSKIKELVEILSVTTKKEQRLAAKDKKVKFHSFRNYTLTGFADRNDSADNSRM